MSEMIKKPESKELFARIEKFRELSLARPNLQRVSGGLLQVAFLFDTTGSMYPYFERVKQSIFQIAKTVTEKQPNISFCFVAYKNHGDERYFDGKNPYLATAFSSSPLRLRSDLEMVLNGGGGDGLCALECVFHHLNTNAAWLPNANMVVVLIGDMPPHGVIDPVSHCRRERHYKDEVGLFKSKRIKVYSVFCRKEEEAASLRRQRIEEFFKWIARETGGHFLELSEIEEIIDLLCAICMKETGHLDEFLAGLKSKGLLSAGSSKEKTLLALTDGKR